MPVGFFDGTDHDGTAATSTNENAYGLYDLSGNVDEWVNDPGLTNSLVFRGTYGGSWFSPLPTLSERSYARPSDTRGSRGFRVSSSYGGNGGRFWIVRIPYYACLSPFQRTTGELVGEAARKAEEDGQKRKWNVLETDTSKTPGTQGGVLKKTDEGAEIVVPIPGGGAVPGGGVPSVEVSGEVSPI